MASYVRADPFDYDQDEFDDFIDFEDMDSGDEGASDTTPGVAGGGRERPSAEKHGKSKSKSSLASKKATKASESDDEDDGTDDDHDEGNEDGDDNESEFDDEFDEYFEEMQPKPRETTITDPQDTKQEQAFDQRLAAAQELVKAYPDLAKLAEMSLTPGTYASLILNALIIHRHEGDEGFREYLKEELAAVAARQSALTAANDRFAM